MATTGAAGAVSLGFRRLLQAHPFRYPMQAAGPAATFRAEGYRKQDTLPFSNQFLLHSTNKKLPYVSSPHLLFPFG